MKKLFAIAAIAAASAVMTLTPASADQYRNGYHSPVQTVGYGSKHSYQKYRYAPRTHYYGYRYNAHRPWWSYQAKKRWNNRLGWSYGYPHNRWR